MIKNRKSMEKTEFRKRNYEAPQCELLHLDGEYFICTSVLPKVPGSSEEKWENEKEEIGGEFEP